MIPRRFSALCQTIGSAALLVVMPCCGGKVTTDAAHVSDVESHDARFVGTWVLEDPNFDALHAQAWTLSADGAMFLVDQINSGNDLGTVEHGSTSCRFGEEWSSDGSTTLRVTVRCSDGRSRSAGFAFPDDASKNAQFVPIQIVDVDGEGGWARPRWSEWQMHKCADVASCTRGWHR